MTLLEKINHLNLKPRNAPAGVKVSTFGEWLRKLRSGQDIGEIPTSLLTLYCDGRINESGGLKLGSAENFSERRVTGQYGSQKVEFEPAKVEMPSAPLIGEAKKRVKDFELPSGSPGTCVEKVPAKKPSVPAVEKRTVTLQPFALNTMDDPMTRKIKSDKGFNYWILYCKENKYRLELADAGCSIVTEEGTFVLSDFVKK